MRAFFKRSKRSIIASTQVPYESNHEELNNFLSINRLSSSSLLLLLVLLLLAL